jgi:hypothetical protein
MKNLPPGAQEEQSRFLESGIVEKKACSAGFQIWEVACELH